MVVLMFDKRFFEAVANGTKRQTIRPARKRPIKVGDLLSLRRWEGAPYRTGHVILGEKVCSRVAHLWIGRTFKTPVVEIDGCLLREDEWSRFVRDDGFASGTEFLDYFRATYGLPFKGVAIWWEYAS